MPDAPLTSDSPPDVTEAVRALLPQLRSLAVTAIAITSVALVAAGAATIWILSSPRFADGDRDFWLAPAFAGIAAAIFAYGSMRKKQEALVMPVLASAIGLSYAKDATGFIEALPARLLPARGRKGGEDYLYGNLGPHAIRMAEVKAETGGKNSRTLFKGVVAQFPNRVAMPAFFIALEDKTRPGFFFGGDLSTEGLHHLRDVSGGVGRSYSIWVSDPGKGEPPALAAVVNILTRLQDHIGNGAQLYAATSNGVEMHVALSHLKNLFRVGGLFPNEGKLFDDVRTAMQDLTMPLTLAKALIEAEEAATAKVNGA